MSEHPSLPSDPAFVVLAAGRGSRFGGAKQLEPVGPSGEPLWAYAVFDALAEGFERVVVVARPELVDRISVALRGVVKDIGRAEVVAQLSGLEQADLEKPWGTGHAVLSARAAVGERPFAVVNGDDWYGRNALRTLRRLMDTTEHCLVTYPVSVTLEATEHVSRGLCRISESGALESIDEVSDVAYAKDGSITGLDPGGKRVTLAHDAPVSMTLWGFGTSIWDLLESEWRDFVDALGVDRLRVDGPGNDTAEFLLTAAIDRLVREERIVVRSASTDEHPYGLTAPADLDRVRRRIAELVAQGHYPADLRSGL